MLFFELIGWAFLLGCMITALCLPTLILIWALDGSILKKSDGDRK